MLEWNSNWHVIENSPLVYTLNKVIYGPEEKAEDFELAAANPAFASKTGLALADCQGRLISQWLLAASVDGEAWLERFCRAADTSQRQEFSEILIFNGIWYSVTAYTPQPGYLHILLHKMAHFHQLMDELKRTRDAYLETIEQSMARSEKLVRHSPSSIIFYEVKGDGSTSSDYIIRDTNPICLKTEGWRREDVIGKSIGDVRPGVDQFGIIEAFQTCWQTGETVSFPARIYRDDDIEKWFENIIFRISAQEIVSVYSDITEQVRINEALYAEKEQLDVTLRSIGDAIIVTDRSGHITIMNAEAERLTGWLQAEAIGLPLSVVFNIFNETTGQVGENPVARVLEKGVVVGLANHTVLKAKDGHVHAINDSAAPIRNARQEIIGVVLVFRDVTEERKKQAQIEFLSYQDALTGLYNRHYFGKVYKQINLATALPLFIVMGDLSGLKLINDAFGHQAGDEILIGTSQAISQNLTPGDLAFRWGGDEFLLVLPQTSRDKGLAFLKKISQDCSEVSYRDIRVNTAFGYASRVSQLEKIEDVIKKAEGRMYRHKLLDSHASRSDILSSIKLVLFEKSYETQEHAHRLAALGRLMSEKLNLSADAADNLEILAMLHDIGKIAVDNAILNKTGRLNYDDWEKLKMHPEIGYRIARGIPELNDVAEYILAHHERWDGKGYPRGLKGEQIPLLSRILSIIDAYDAMTGYRTYEQRITKQEAINELILCSGTQFDPQLVPVFISIVENNQPDGAQ